jgi:hypothetical protein
MGWYKPDFLRDHRFEGGRHGWARQLVLVDSGLAFAGLSAFFDRPPDAGHPH